MPSRKPYDASDIDTEAIYNAFHISLHQPNNTLFNHQIQPLTYIFVTVSENFFSPHALVQFRKKFRA